MSELPASDGFDVWGGRAVVAATDSGALDTARASVQRTIREFDDACSRFRDDSEISALNRAAGQPMRVTPLLLSAVTAAVRAARLTGGDVDPTVGGALIALGYDRSFDQLPDRYTARLASTTSFAAVPGWRALAIDARAQTIRLPRGVSLDLGATAKALAADYAARAASEQAGCGVLVSLSGDVAVAGEAPEGGWRVRVTDDHRADATVPGQHVTIRSGGLATSSTTTRRWMAGQVSAHHIIDPATSRPATVVWRTASVTAASCLDANIASTAAIVRGRAAGSWLETLGLPSRLVDAAGVPCHLAGWPPARDELR